MTKPKLITRKIGGTSFVATVGAVGDDPGLSVPHGQFFPAANQDDLVRIETPNAGKTGTRPWQFWRCTTNNTAANDPARWELLSGQVRIAHIVRNNVPVRVIGQTGSPLQVVSGPIIPISETIPALNDGNLTTIAKTVGSSTTTINVTLNPNGATWDTFSITARSNNRTTASPTTATIFGNDHVDWSASDRDIAADFNAQPGVRQTLHYYAGSEQTGPLVFQALNWAAGGTFDLYEFALSKRESLAQQVYEYPNGTLRDLSGAVIALQPGESLVYELVSDAGDGVWQQTGTGTFQFIPFADPISELPNTPPNALNHGAIADGLPHLLSETYNSLEEAQAKFPAAIALTDTQDWAALQSLIDSLRTDFEAAVTANGNAFPDLNNVGTSNPEIFLGTGPGIGVYVLNRKLDIKGMSLVGAGQDYYVVRQNGFASPTNTVKGPILQFVENGGGFPDSVCIDMSPDNSRLSRVTVDGDKLNKGTVAVGSTFVIYDGGQKVSESQSGRGQVGNGFRFIVIDPDDPEQGSASIQTDDLPPIYLGEPEYEEYLLAWPGQYTTLNSQSWALAAGSDVLPPGLTLETNGRLHGTFNPAIAGDYRTYSPTVQYTYTVDGGSAVSITKELKIGVITGYVEDFSFPDLTESRSVSFDLRIMNDGGEAHTTAIVSTNLPGVSVSTSGTITANPGANTAGQYYIELSTTHVFSGQAITRRYENISVVSQDTAPTFANLDDLKRVWEQGEFRSVKALVRGGEDALTLSVDPSLVLSGFENENAGYPRIKSGETTIWEIGPGVEFDGTTGILSGTPTNANRYTFYIKVVDNQGRTNIQPVILTPEQSHNSKPFIFSTGFPPAIKGVAYNHTIDIRNPGAVTIEDVVILPLPTGLSINSSGVISGTPLGMTLANGLSLRFSAVGEYLTVRNFHSAAGIASSGSRTIPGTVTKQSNLHRFNHVIIKNCRYGMQLGQAYDSHWQEFYIAGCWIGIDLQSGAAAHTFSDFRIEFIGRYGVQGAFANENIFTNCYWDTCGYAGMIMNSCKNLTLNGCLFFRSGRLVPGQEFPLFPNAVRSRSCHIYLTGCEKATLNAVKTLVGHESEGVSLNNARWEGQLNWARPATALNYFNCKGLIVDGCDLTGCTHESLVSGGLNFYDTLPVFEGNQINRYRLDESKHLKYKIDHNLLYNSGVIVNQRQSTYPVTPGGVADSRAVFDGWELSWGAINENISLTRETVSDRRLPFKYAMRLQKTAESGATGEDPQTLILLNNTMADQLREVAGKTLIISFFAKSNIADGGNILSGMTFNSGDSSQGGATALYGGDSEISQSWKRYYFSIQAPRLEAYTFDLNFSSFVGWRLLFDQAARDYDVLVGGFQCELAPESLLPRDYNAYAEEQEWAFAYQHYQKSLPFNTYFGETGANFKNAGTQQQRSDGIHNPLIRVNFPVPLNEDIAVGDNKMQIISYRAAANRLDANFNAVNQINPGAGTAYPFNIAELSKTGFTVEVLPNVSLPMDGAIALFHWEYDSAGF